MPTGVGALIEVLAQFGVRYIFGNPGTTELPLNDLLVADRRIRYVLGLQEVPVMAMADGYAMASGKLGVVNLHISCGLGNAMGMLYNAFREGTPLLVTAGQQDRRLAFEEPILGGDMVAVTRPWTKWSCEVHRVQDLPRALHRAAQAALTPPTGPVFLSIPVDVQQEYCADLDLTPIRLPDPLVRPPRDALSRAIEILVGAKNPGILAGSRITERQATAELAAVADLLGSPVISESGTTHGRLAFPSDHDLNAQGLPLWSPEIRERLSEFDVLLVVGMDLLRQYVYHEPSRAIPESIRLVHFDEDPWQLGKNYPCEVGVLGHIKIGLQELASGLRDRMDNESRHASRERREKRVAAHREQRRLFAAKVAEEALRNPISPLGLMGTIAKVLPANAAVVEEAVTTTNTTLERLGALRNTTGYFGHRGWALGWGLGVATGAKLAWPDRPVLGILGEGAALYGIQGLWTAANQKLPVSYVICNNSQYQILKIGARGLGLPHALQGKYEALDLIHPEIDMVGLARAMGVEAHRVSTLDELGDRLTQAWTRDAPLLLDVPISRDTQNRLNYG